MANNHAYSTYQPPQRAPHPAASPSPLIRHVYPTIHSLIGRPEPAHTRPTYSVNYEQSGGGIQETSEQEGGDCLDARARRPSMFSRFLGLLSSRRSRIPDDRDSNIVRKKLEDHPEGYPRVAAFVNSDKDTVLFRRFGSLHSRLLLYKEVELTELETKLASLDRDDSLKDETRWRLHHSIHRDEGSQNEERKALVENIEPKLLAYDKLLLHDEHMRRLSRPSERVHRNFMDYMYTENPFGENEQQFIFHEDDFVTLQLYEESWLDQFLHRVLLHCKKPFLRHIFVSKKDQAKTKDTKIRYYSDDRLGVLIKIIIALASTTLLLIPVYLFVTLNTISIKVLASITLFFAFMFATALSIFTSAKRQEIFAATAAYCAVLVVFLGNLQQRDWARNIQSTSPT